MEDDIKEVDTDIGFEGNFIPLNYNYKTYINDQHLLKYGNDLSISKKLVIDILKNEKIIDFLKENYDNENGIIKIHNTYYSHGIDDTPTSEVFYFSAEDICKLISQLNIRNIKLYIKCKKILNFLSYKGLKERVKGKAFDIDIMGRIYSLPISSILTFLELDDNKFKELIESKKEIYGMPIKYFLYVVNKYCQTRLCDKYILNDKILQRIEQIKNNDQIGEVINEIAVYQDNKRKEEEYLILLDECKEGTNPILEKFTVSKELEDAVLGDMPKNYSPLEKAIYIYIKMCKLLTYDEEYYASEQKDVKQTKKHRSFDYISTIKPKTNNKIVCYEFNAIYSYFLNMLGIDYVICSLYGNKFSEKDFESYLCNHSFLRFRVDDYVIMADSVQSLLDSDLTSAKLNQALTGIVCLHYKEEVRNKFNEILLKVYNDIAKKEPKTTTNEVGKISESADDILSQFTDAADRFSKITDKLESISIETKIDILVKKINSASLDMMDSLQYIMKLKHILFTEEELENIGINIIKNVENEEISCIVIISILKDDEYKRYKYIPGKKLETITDSDLLMGFEIGKFGYIYSDDPIIPGFDFDRSKSEDEAKLK